MSDSENVNLLIPQSRSTASLCAGDKVRLTKSIWDDGEDHHPPGWLAMKGEILVVRSVGNIGAARIAVSHENVTDSSFLISCDEFEAHNVEVQGPGAASLRTVHCNDGLAGTGDKR